VLAITVVLAGCGGKSPSMLKTHGSEASRIAGIWWLMFGLGAGVYAVVAFFIVWAIVRGRRAEGSEGRVSDNLWIVWGGVVVPVLILAVLAVVTVQATSELRKPEAGALQVEVVGKRWWWAVSYPGTAVTTANEIRLPAGRQVEIGLDSDNVVHSFWVPQLAGKLDLIPGQHNILRFTPRTPGTYIGECAEFCGVEHARMGFVVIVQTTTDFDRWMTRHQLTPSAPDGEAASQGEVTLATQACAGCHAIRGTPAQGTVGPDLTDFGARTTIGARTVPNTPENLAKWIVDAQALKPGALMPPIPMSDRDVNNVIAYLEGLK
jgi:cytochrome c oxidase subunit 2